MVEPVWYSKQDHFNDVSVVNLTRAPQENKKSCEMKLNLLLLFHLLQINRYNSRT
jgi:hypothetical protein